MAKIQLNGRKITIKSKFSILDLLKKYKKLNKEKRVEEIAKMISGEVITEDALKVASQLINEK